MKAESYTPRAVQDGLIIERLDDELLVFDEERNRAHSLNQTAAQVWRACDGNHDIQAIQAECGLDEDTVQLALEELRTAHLLAEPKAANAVSRRTMLRKSLIAGAAAGAAIPVIRSITAPSAALAASTCVTKGSGSCNTTSKPCCSGVCNASSSCANSCFPTGHGCSSNSSCCYGSPCVLSYCGGPPG